MEPASSSSNRPVSSASVATNVGIQDFLRIKVVHLDFDCTADIIFSFAVKENVDGALVQPKPNFCRPFGQHFDSHLKPGRVLEIALVESENDPLPPKAQCSILLAALARNEPDDEYQNENGILTSVYQVPVVLQPVGKLTLQVKWFMGKRPISGLAAGRLPQRQGAHKRPKVHLVGGHQLVAKFFNGFTFCSHCSDFLWGFNKQGYQCELCNIAVHKRCHDKLLNACSKSPVPPMQIVMEEGKTLELNKEHSFKTKNFTHPRFCDHCGRFLWGFTNQGMKCVKCKTCVHHRCAPLAAKTCGLNVKEYVERMHKLRQRQRLGSTSSQMSLVSSTGRPRSWMFNSDASSSMIDDDMDKPFYEDPVGFLPQLSQNSEQGDDQRRHSVIASTDRKLGLKDFKLQKLLGKGSFGKVYLASLDGDADVTGLFEGRQQLFAIKSMNIEFVFSANDLETTRVERKIAQITTQARAPFLLHMLCTFKSSTHLFYVYDFLSGGDLMFHLRRLNQFSVPQTRFYAAEIVIALDFLHRHNIIYRDLKLDNIMLDREGHVCLVDYGLCKDEISESKRASTFCGTPGYIAPEIIEQKEYTFSVDWWSFGVIIYEMVTGVTPFYGQDEAELFGEILNPELPDMSLVEDDSCVAILLALFERNPENRLACNGNGVDDIKQAPFFTPAIEWLKIEHRAIAPPFVPSKDYMRNFDRDFTRATVRLTNYDYQAGLTQTPSGQARANQGDLMRTIPQDLFAKFSFTNQDYTPACQNSDTT